MLSIYTGQRLRPDHSYRGADRMHEDVHVAIFEIARSVFMLVDILLTLICQLLEYLVLHEKFQLPVFEHRVKSHEHRGGGVVLLFVRV